VLGVFGFVGIQCIKPLYIYTAFNIKIMRPRGDAYWNFIYMIQCLILLSLP
jgi:hypothetical protein